MKIPLIIKTENNRLKIYQGGGFFEEPLPFSPFVLVEKDKIEYSNDFSTEVWTKLPDNKPVEYSRINFETTEDMFNFRKRNFGISKHIYSNNYIDQLYISNKDYLLKFEDSSDIKVMFWDIETKTVGDGRFSKPTDQPILCIGYSIWSVKSDMSKKKLTEEVIDLFDDGHQDYFIIKKFIDVINKENIDVLAGFNSEEFDFPYLFERARIMKIDTKPITRDNRESWIDEKGRISINGRIHYDIMKKVMKDQSLFGMKSRNLKETARHYKVPLSSEEDIELKEEITNTYKLFKENHTKLINYQKADVIRTEHVGFVYLRNDIILAEKLKVSLEHTMNSYPSFIPKIMICRNLWEKRFISTETNYSKYNKDNGTIYKLGTKIKGALCGLYKSGFLSATYKIDFISQYSSAICNWNLGPDTTFLHSIEPFTGKYIFTRDNNYNWYRIPDANFNVDVIIKVKNNEEGFLKKEIESLWGERNTMKKEMKIATGERYGVLNSQQMAIKILYNSIYGVLALPSSTYTDLAIGLFVTGMCRWTTSKVISLVKSSTYELDTDGAYLDREPKIEEINSYLKDLMKSIFGFDKSYMVMELETFQRSFFCLAKNYIIEKDGKIEIHGSSLKTSRAPKVVDKARDLAIQHIFNNKPIEEVVREAYDFKLSSLKDFEMRIRLSKDPKEYDDPKGIANFVSRQVEVKTGQSIKEGTQLSYVVTKNQLPDQEFQQFYQKKTKGGKNYTSVEYVSDINELDFSYYNEQIDKMLERFKIRKITQTDLFGQEDRQEYDQFPEY